MSIQKQPSKRQRFAPLFRLEERDGYTIAAAR
jgi:hypothetical protein